MGFVVRFQRTGKLLPSLADASTPRCRGRLSVSIIHQSLVAALPSEAGGFPLRACYVSIVFRSQPLPLAPRSLRRITQTAEWLMDASVVRSFPDHSRPHSIIYQEDEL